MSDLDDQVIATTSDTIALIRDLPETTEDEENTFVHVTGLGGRNVKPQNRDGAWWASIYTSTQSATFGALFGVFNFGGDPRMAYFYFKNINGEIIDEFYVRSTVGGDYSLNAAVIPFGSGTASFTPPGGRYDDGATVSVSALPAAGFEFDHWQDDLSGAANPESITMDGDKSVTATFAPAPTYDLTVTVEGAGSVPLDPAGGAYSAGTEVNLTANVDPGWQFFGWSGDLTGAQEAATITIDSDKAVTATFIEQVVTGEVAYEETQTGTATSNTSVSTSSDLTAVSGDLYLVTITSKPNRPVVSVAGLGLTWGLIKDQCSGRNQTRVGVWMAQGNPVGNGAVTAFFESTPSAAAIVVSRYSGVDPVSPIGNVVSGNSNGQDGACSGGSDDNSYSFDIPATSGGVMIYGAAAMRNKTHQPDAGFAERTEVIAGSGGSAASVAVIDQSIVSATTVSLSGAFASATFEPVSRLTTTLGLRADYTAR